MGKSYPLRKKKLAAGGQINNYGVPSTNAEYVNSQKEAAALTTGLGFVPVWGQYAAVGMGAGQALGKQTMNEQGIYKSKAGQFLDNNFNPATGIQNIKDLWKKPTGSGILNQLTVGLFGNSATQSRRKKAIADANALRVTRRNQEIGGRAYGNEANALYSGTQFGGTKPQFADGGQIDKLGLVKGGHLQPVAGPVVQVKANEPGRDKVETPSAMLDHNEIVDVKKGQVFSNRIEHPAGGTIASKAKVKAKRGESLDPLFDLQESLKSNNMPSHNTGYQKSSAINMAPPRTKKLLSNGGKIEPSEEPGPGPGKRLVGSAGLPQGRTAMGLKIKPKSNQPPIGGVSKQRPVKIQNFNRTGFR